MRVHLSQSVTGPLTNWNQRDWQKALKWINKSDGTPFGDWMALKQSFLNELALGHEVVPIGDCDNFDWKEGCKGHPDEPTDKSNEPPTTTGT